MASQNDEGRGGANDFETITDIYKRRSRTDLTERDREVLMQAQSTMARWVKIGFFSGAIGLPLVLLRGRYAIRNLRNLPPLIEGGRANNDAVKDRLLFFAKGSGLGVLGGFMGGALGMLYGKSRVQRLLADSGSTDRVKEFQRHVMEDMKEEMGDSRPQPGPRRGTASLGRDDRPHEGNFLPEDESYYAQQTVDDRGFDAQDSASRPPFTSSQPQPPAKAPSRWETIRQDRTVKPSTWDRIRQDRARTSSNTPRSDDRERTESSTYDPRLNTDKERERKEFEELLERERKMGEEGGMRAAKEDKWA